MYRRLISMWFKSSHLYYCIKNKNNKRFAKTEIKKKKLKSYVNYKIELLVIELLEFVRLV